MATVNLTATLKSEIEKNLAARFEPKIEGARAELQAQAELIYSSWVPPPVENALLALPRDCYVTMTTFYVSLKDRIDILSISLPSPRPARGLIDHYARHTGAPPPPNFNGGSVTVNIGTYIPQPGDACYEVVTEIYARRHKYMAQRDQLIKDMSALMNQCANLKQLEKVWPSMVEFVPEAYLAKHRDTTKKEVTKFDPSTVTMGDSTKALLVKTLVTT